MSNAIDIVVDPIIVQQSLSRKKLGQAEIDLIRKTIAPTATNEELEVFIYTCNTYGLDPLRKEIYFTKYGGKSTIITSRDGYVKIANEHPMFDGMEADVVYSGDRMERRDNGSIKMIYGDDHFNFDPAKIRGAYANVYRKDRTVPSTALVSARDYLVGSTNPMAKKFPNAMILKVAEATALKKAFSLSGLLVHEEMGQEDEEEKIQKS
jgi:phage recombination protein Bet